MTKTTSMAGASDEDLFLYMAFRETPGDKAMADLAFDEMHRRYAESLYARCIKRLRNESDPSSAATQVAVATLLKAYNKAHTYRPADDPSKSADRTSAWLCTIANRLLIDHKRNPQRPGPLNVVDLDVHADDFSPEDFAALYTEGDKNALTREYYQCVAAAFELLDQRTQKVLIHTIVQRSRTPGGGSMYRGTAKSLAIELGTTTANLGRIRMLGIKSINDYVAQRMTHPLEESNV